MAPDFALKDLSGNLVTLSDYRGQTVLLDFWATWCPPCRMSIPELVKVQKKYKKKGVVILGVSLDEPHQVPNSLLRSFIEKTKINYPILRYNAKILKSYFPNVAPSIPTMFVIDQDGMIRDTIVGYSPGAVEKSLARVL